LGRSNRFLSFLDTLTLLAIHNAFQNSHNSSQFCGVTLSGDRASLNSCTAINALIAIPQTKQRNPGTEIQARKPKQRFQQPKISSVQSANWQMFGQVLALVLNPIGAAKPPTNPWPTAAFLAYRSSSKFSIFNPRSHYDRSRRSPSGRGSSQRHR
jgi:hypothetical protein